MLFLLGLSLFLLPVFLVLRKYGELSEDAAIQWSLDLPFNQRLQIWALQQVGIAIILYCFMIFFLPGVI